MWSLRRQGRSFGSGPAVSRPLSVRRRKAVPRTSKSTGMMREWASSPIRYADPTIEVTADGCYLDIYRVPFQVVRTEFQEYVDIAGRPPLRGATTLAEIDAHRWPTADMWDYEPIGAALDAHADKATECQSRGFFEISHFVRGMDKFLTDLALDPPLACAVLDHVIDHLLERARRVLEAGGGRYTIFEYNDDVASQRALLISPDRTPSRPTRPWRTSWRYSRPRSRDPPPARRFNQGAGSRGGPRRR